MIDRARVDDRADRRGRSGAQDCRPRAGSDRAFVQNDADGAGIGEHAERRAADNLKPGGSTIDRAGVIDDPDRPGRDIHTAVATVDRAGVVDESDAPDRPQAQAVDVVATDRPACVVGHRPSRGKHGTGAAARDRTGVGQRAERRAGIHHQAGVDTIDRARVGEIGH